MVLVAVLRVLRKRGDPRAARIDLLGMLDLVALATVCDVVPLKGLNRAYVVKGLVAVRQMGNAGLAALIRRVGIGGPVTPYHLGFLIGPRINAGGRIGDAALGSRLLTLDDAAEADLIAAELDQLNRERQAMEAAMLAEAEAEALAEGMTRRRAGGRRHGARRLASGHRRAARRAAQGEAAPAGLRHRLRSAREGAPARAARSPGFDLGSMVREAVERGLLVKGGGHGMAAGLTVERGRLGDLRAFFEEHASDAVAELVGSHALKLDGALAASGATMALIDDLERAGPVWVGTSATGLRTSGAPPERCAAGRAEPSEADRRRSRRTAGSGHRLPRPRHAARQGAARRTRPDVPLRRHAFRRPLAGRPARAVQADRRGPGGLTEARGARRPIHDGSFGPSPGGEGRAGGRSGGWSGTPKGNRTPVSAVRGRRPGPLDDGRPFSGSGSCAAVLAVHPPGQSPAGGYGTPNGTRTRVSAVKGRRPRPLDDGRPRQGAL